MKTGTSIYLTDRDKTRIKDLQKVYDTESVSELIRILVEKEYKTVQVYRELNV